MAKNTRNIIKIDEEKCNGCGLCIPACKEGALQIVNGKATLIKDSYCDGLGVCLGQCPQGALTIEERPADEFDESSLPPLPCGCPGTMTKSFEPKKNKINNAEQVSQLRQWPIQLTLMPINAPYLKNADLLLLADCTAVAYANLHQDFLRQHVIAMACPKLDNTKPYLEKLTQIIIQNNLKSITVVMMEVPCCHGLKTLAEQALKNAGSDLTLKTNVITIEGGSHEYQNVLLSV
ncbi:MAG: 4Fe-4S binding protein [Pseudomonadota bacterium]